MTGPWVFVLPIDLSSANLRIVNGKDRVAGAKYRRARDHAAALVRWEATRSGMLVAHLGDDEPTRWGRRRVTITRLMGKGQRAFDDDNIAAACKGLRDAMQRPRMYGKRMKFGTRTSGIVVQVPIAGAGIVWDDSSRWSEWRYAQERSADGRAGVRIEVEDIEDLPAKPVRTPDEALAAIGAGVRRPVDAWERAVITADVTIWRLPVGVWAFAGVDDHGPWWAFDRTQRPEFRRRGSRDIDAAKLAAEDALAGRGPDAATAWASWAAGSLDHRPGAYDDVPGIGPDRDTKPENVPAKPARSTR